MENVDIYRVGLLQDLYICYRQLFYKYIKRNSPTYTPIKTLFKYIKKSYKYKNYYNGYLAEHDDGASSAGHGWTKKRAINSLIKLRQEKFGG